MKDDRVACVMDYHTRSKHEPDRYAKGPETLDWDEQPNVFRDWSDTLRISLPSVIVVSDISWGNLPAVRAAQSLNVDVIGSFMRLCVGLSAWKEYAGSRWSLRVHPSSGNLHPTETWMIATGVTGLEDGLYHYHNLHHVLERRAWGGASGVPGLWLGLSSIHWREEWKYGERAYRYCQLDMGHVLAAVCYAAALHGWRAEIMAVDSAYAAQALGLDRRGDFVGVENEEAEVIVKLYAVDAALPSRWSFWGGKPASLDAHPMYRWPVIDEVAKATRGAPPRGDPVRTVHAASAHLPDNDIGAAQVILKRRSAQAFDGQSVMPNELFGKMLAALLPGGSPVWEMWPHNPRVHPVLMVHRVEGIAPGLYALPRSDSAIVSLQAAFRETFTWRQVDVLPLFQLLAARAGKTARSLSCHQDIAGQSAFTLMMVAEFAAPIADDPAAYRHLHWEAGMLGHVLTLSAEAAGWRGTGIGCFFDDVDHELLGLVDQKFQVIYHYAIGMALDDPRIASRPAY